MGLAIALSIPLIAAMLICLFVIFRSSIRELVANHRVKNLKKSRYKHCDSMWHTAMTENEIYGGIVSGSVENHVKDCDYCKYVLYGDRKNLNKHRADMAILESEWKK